MAYVGKVTLGESTHLVGSTLYGTCATAAGTAAKVVTCEDFSTLMSGVTLHVKFTYSNTASNATLNVNSTGAKSLCMYGSTPVGTTDRTSWKAGAVVSLTYDGTSWVMNDYIPDTDSTYDTLTQSAVTTGTETTGKLITAKIVRDSIDTAVSSAISGLGDVFTFKGVVDAVSDLPSSGKTGDVYHVNADEGEYVWDGDSWESLGPVLNIDVDISLNKTTDTVKGINAWSAGSLPALTVSNKSIPNVTGVGSAPSLTKSDKSIPNVTSVGSVPSLTTNTYTIPNVTSVGSATTATVQDGVLTITEGTAPTLGTAFSVKGVNSWSAGSAPTLGTAISATYISAWSAGSTPTLGTAISVGSASGWSAGSLPSLTNTEKTFVTDVTATTSASTN